uniref:Protein ECM7 n=1 Tax=Parastrongyloides trichosuri TaxID=131310 RepID=A0A0N4ZBF6_PARTI
MVRRRIPLSIYFIVEVFAFIISLIALTSPSWQYVYLEDGRTEHHHGLWLDCKRDYSNDYGRTKEYYESLYRLADQGNPFDKFYLPQFMCVYKFDYYIDPEDLYEHNYDENKLQDDANQHLLLAWKAVALSAFTLSITSSISALLIGVCAFCHRTLTCASTVLVTIAAFFSIIGNLVFYIWANYQDNNVIKEEDGIYEQFIGWAFYASTVGTILHIFASALGCLTTSFSFNTAKIVKIDVENSEDPLITISSQPSLDKEGNFKRSFSAVYKVDSAALRKFERECARSMRNKEIQMAQMMKSQQSINHFTPFHPINPENMMPGQINPSFKRANSVPNFKRYNNSSVSSNCAINNSSIVTEPIPHNNSMSHQTQQQISAFQRRPSTFSLRKTFNHMNSGTSLNKSVSFTNLNNINSNSKKRKPSISEVSNNFSDTTYEYVPLQSRHKNSQTNKKQKTTNLNFIDNDNPDDVYSSIYAQGPISNFMLSNNDKLENDYLKPNTIPPPQSTSFGTEPSLTSILKKDLPLKETFINDVQKVTEFDVKNDNMQQSPLKIINLPKNAIKLPIPPLPPKVIHFDALSSTENVNKAQTKSILKVNSSQSISASNTSLITKQTPSSNEDNTPSQTILNKSSNKLYVGNNKIKTNVESTSPKIGQRFYRKRSSSRGHRAIPNSVKINPNPVQKQSLTQSSDDYESECDRSLGSCTYINNDRVPSQLSSSSKNGSEGPTSETIV